jgi:hypothetical protein
MSKPDRSASVNPVNASTGQFALGHLVQRLASK